MIPVDLLLAAGAGLLLGGSLLLTFVVPWGGRVSLGLVLAMTLPALLGTRSVAVAAGLALVIVGIACRRNRAANEWVPMLARHALSVSAASAAVPTLQLVVDDPSLLACVAASAAGVMVAELAWFRVGGSDAPAQLRAALGIYLTLIFGAGLLTVAVDTVGVGMAAVAVLPIALARYSFERHAEAAETLRQTVQALGLVPELAGLAPLGHSERSAVYAAAIASELGFDLASIDRVVTATRLHHIGAVQQDEEHDDARDHGTVAAHGARILRESGFPADVADLLESARADGLGGPSASLAAAAVRIATAFDHVVGEDPSATDRGLALVSGVSLDPDGRRAAAALLTCVATTPCLVTDAIAAGSRFRDAADGLDLEALVAEVEGADLVPFARRIR